MGRRRQKLTGEPIVYRRRKSFERTCVVCEETFRTTRKDALYDSPRCRQIGCRAARALIPTAFQVRIRARLRALGRFL